jgi:transcriptional regulator of NAD metabolism
MRYKIDDELEETLHLKQQSYSELTTDQLKLLVNTSRNELEYLVKLLQELDECRKVLDQDFTVSDKKKAQLHQIASDDTPSLVDENHTNLSEIITQCNQYYEQLSKLFAGYHHVLEELET